MTYKPGLHILSEIFSDEKELLKDYNGAKKFVNERVNFYQLNKVGEVFHNFEGGGYTGVVCLTESHLALHTWPEYGMLTLDIYLSNCKKENDDKARSFFKDIVSFFNSTKYTSNEVKR